MHYRHLANSILPMEISETELDSFWLLCMFLDCLLPDINGCFGKFQLKNNSI